MVSENIRQLCVKTVAKSIPCSQHRPIVCSINAAIKPTIVPMKGRFNFRKVNWIAFRTKLDMKITNLVSTTKTFVNTVKRILKNHILRGCRIEYITGLFSELTEHMHTYTEMYDRDHVEYDTINKVNFC